MSFIQRTALHCDVCGHEWLMAKKPFRPVLDLPSHCAKCKSRLWNKGGPKPEPVRERTYEPIE